MAGDSRKYDLILDALQRLLLEHSVQTISVSDIAQAAGIGKGSIYYYFPSKEAIVEALVQRNYEAPLKTAQSLSARADIPAFTRMAMIFRACRSSSAEYAKRGEITGAGAREKAFLHLTYMNHIITALKPVLSEIVRQGIQAGEIRFDRPEELAEMVLIILTVKMDNIIVPSTKEEIEGTIAALVSLLEKGTENPPGSLDFLIQTE